MDVYNVSTQITALNAYTNKGQLLLSGFYDSDMTKTIWTFQQDKPLLAFWGTETVDASINSLGYLTANTTLCNLIKQAIPA